MPHLLNDFINHKKVLFDVIMKLVINMYYVGIDIGSTASKVVVLDDSKKKLYSRKLCQQDGVLLKQAKLSKNGLNQMGLTKIIAKLSLRDTEEFLFHLRTKLLQK